MKIASSQLNLSSTHHEVEQREVHERLRIWNGERPPRNAGTSADGAARNDDSAPTRLSAAARQLAAALAPATAEVPPQLPPALTDTAAADESSAIAAALEDAENDPMLVLLRGMLERLFGIHIRRSASDERRAAEPPPGLQKNPGNAALPASRPQWGVEYEYHEQRSESETTRFAAEGTVRTVDGVELRFELRLEMSRSFTERIDVAWRAGAAARQKDPLLVNFGGSAAQLSDRRFEIDLDGDGSLETARFAAPGSGFLVFDRNGDGRINDGREMFGPSTGDGFAELAAFDDDGNGWIDENDAIYARLQVWSRGPDGADRLESLPQADVGAIALARLATPFALKDEGNTLLGQVRSSSVYLGNDGRVGSVQQVDLAV